MDGRVVDATVLVADDDAAGDDVVVTGDAVIV